MYGTQNTSMYQQITSRHWSIVCVTSRPLLLLLSSTFLMRAPSCLDFISSSHIFASFRPLVFAFRRPTAKGLVINIIVVVLLLLLSGYAIIWWMATIWTTYFYQSIFCGRNDCSKYHLLQGALTNIDLLSGAYLYDAGIWTNNLFNVCLLHHHKTGTLCYKEIKTIYYNVVLKNKAI